MLVDRLELYGSFILGELSKLRTKEDITRFFSIVQPRTDENIAQLSAAIDPRMPNCFGYLDFHQVSNTVIDVYIRWRTICSKARNFEKKKKKKTGKHDRITFLSASENMCLNLQHGRQVIINLISCCTFFIYIDKTALCASLFYLCICFWKKLKAEIYFVLL